MASKQNDYNTNLKFYHILILNLFLSILLILNSNYVSSQRKKEKMNKEKDILFNKIIYNRRLEGEEDEKKSNSDKICEKGSESLVEYYKNGNLEVIELDDKPIKSEDKDKDYFKALLNIIKIYMGDSKEEDFSENGEPIGHLRNLQSITDIQDDLMTYGKHILPILFFLVVAILCIPGWLICCICCCCNCCCCCCCKKPGCKCPCFIFTYVFYGLSVAICIYGLSQSKSIFVGLADTECSFLKFFDQVLEGETKQEKPNWPGIKNINDILDNLISELKIMKDSTISTLTNKRTSISDGRDRFENDMIKAGKSFYKSDGNTYKDNLIKSSSPIYSHEYILDIVNLFGKYNPVNSKFEPEHSTLDRWENEYKTTTHTADTYMETAFTSFENILDAQVNTLIKNLGNGKDQLNEIKKSFESIEKDIEDVILDYSETIDDYGKLGFRLLFSVLGLMNIALGVFMFFICFFSGKICTNCGCCRCLFKFLTHLLWNILAFLMIIIFLLGSIFCLVGKVGSDTMSLISFIVSVDNTENVIIDKLGDSKSYLDRCINGDGDIISEIGIDNRVDSFNAINNVENQIITAKANFTSLRDNPIIYSIYKTLLDKRVDLTDDTLSLIPIDNSDDSLNFKTKLSELNNDISQLTDENYKKESWGVNGDREIECTSDNIGTQTEYYSSPTIFHPQTCPPSYRKWISEINPTNNIKKNAQIITDIIELINDANDYEIDEEVTDVDYDSFADNAIYKKILFRLKIKYRTLLNTYIGALDAFQNEINRITRSIREYIGEGNGLFDFIKCNFIGTNLKIILKYLKVALGTNVYTVGVCLLVVGCSLILSISSTILLIVVINVSIDENKKKIKLEKSKISEKK